MKIDCIADLHGERPELEGGDLLIVAGDLTASHSLREHSDVREWLHKLPYEHKILVAGNHDEFLQKNPNFYAKSNITYLCDSGTEINGFKIWGSPWTNYFEGMNEKCKAFTGDDYLLCDKFEAIPDDIDILITHGPPYGILDEVERYPEGRYNSAITENVGSGDLLREIERIRPAFHVFGHIHEGYGKFIVKHWPLIGFVDDVVHVRDTLCINCSIMDENYDPINKPVRIQI